MTHARLIEELAAEVEDALKDAKLPVEYQKTPTPEDFVKVNVFAGYLPEDLFENSSYWPCVIIEYLETHDDLKAGSLVTLGISICTFALEADAWKDCLHLMELTRERLLTRLLLAKRFRLHDLKWSTPTEQPREFYIISGEVVYEIFLPQEHLI